MIWSEESAGVSLARDSGTAPRQKSTDDASTRRKMRSILAGHVLDQRVGIEPAPIPRLRQQPARGGARFHATGNGKGAFEERWRPIPERRDRDVMPPVTRVENTLIPPAKLRGKFRVIAHHIHESTEIPQRSGMAVLRHEKYVTGPVASDLRNELTELLRLREVQVCIWFAAVAVAPGDEWLSPLASKLRGSTVLTPSAQAVKFDGGQDRPVLREKL